MTDARTLRALAVLAAAFDKELTEPMAEAYAMVLEDLSPDALGAAVRRLMATARFFPRASEIRAEALGVTGVDGKTDALAAWGKVKRAVGTHGRDREPTWDDPATAFAVAALGWRDYCLSDSDAEMSWRARFVDAYAGYQSRQTDSLMLHGAPSRPEINPPTRPALPDCVPTDPPERGGNAVAVADLLPAFDGTEPK